MVKKNTLLLIVGFCLVYVPEITTLGADIGMDLSWRTMVTYLCCNKQHHQIRQPEYKAPLKEGKKCTRLIGLLDFLSKLSAATCKELDR